MLKNRFSLVPLALVLAIAVVVFSGVDRRRALSVGTVAKVGHIDVEFKRASFMVVRRDDGTMVGDDMRLVVAFSVTNTGPDPVLCDVSFKACSKLGIPYAVESVKGDVFDDANGTAVLPGDSVAVYAVVEVFTDPENSIFVSGDAACDHAGTRGRFTFHVPLSETAAVVDGFHHPAG